MNKKEKEVIKEFELIDNSIPLEEFDDDFDYDEYEDEEVILGSGEWIPLMTLCGPLDDVIDDFYSIFYSRTMDGKFRYKAMAHRWCY